MSTRAEYYVARFCGVGISILIAFGICEFLARRLLPASPSPVTREFPIDTYAEPHPFLMFKGSLDPSKQKIGKLNHAGYRGKFPSREKQPQELRIFVVGGSTVLNGEPSLPELLETKLRSAGFEHAAVYNFGVMASTARLDLSRIVFELLDYSPDLILSYGGGNDIIMNYQGDPRPGYPYNFLLYENNPLYRITSAESYPWWAVLALRSHLLRYIFDHEIQHALLNLDALRADEGWGSEEWSIRIADTYSADLRKTAVLLKGIEVKFAAFFQPLLYFKRLLTTEEANWNFAGLAQHARIVQREVQSEGLSSSMSFEDLSLLFEDTKETVFTDGIHIVQEQQEAVATRIFDALVRMSLMASSN